MGVLNVEVQIKSGTNIGGVSPFVVVCFDNDLSNELYKSGAASGGRKCVWDERFTLDLTTAMKNAVADGRPEPSYLTFNVFDAGVPGMPSLGSAGVMLATVRDQGVAQGDFPIVNGMGTIALVVGQGPESDKKGWVHSDAAKVAGIAGAVGVGALALGLTARHYNNKKKNKNQPGAAASSSIPPRFD